MVLWPEWTRTIGTVLAPRLGGTRFHKSLCNPPGSQPAAPRGRMITTSLSHTEHARRWTAPRRTLLHTLVVLVHGWLVVHIPVSLWWSQRGSSSPPTAHPSLCLSPPPSHTCTCRRKVRTVRAVRAAVWLPAGLCTASRPLQPPMRNSPCGAYACGPLCSSPLTPPAPHAWACHPGSRPQAPGLGTAPCARVFRYGLWAMGSYTSRPASRHSQRAAQQKPASLRVSTPGACTHKSGPMPQWPNCKGRRSGGRPGPEGPPPPATQGREAKVPGREQAPAHRRTTPPASESKDTPSPHSRTLAGPIHPPVRLYIYQSMRPAV